jgi:hypothetical protein
LNNLYRYSMVHNLFDEYRFFPKYPEKELRITAVLFGGAAQLLNPVQFPHSFNGTWFQPLCSYEVIS